MANYFPLKRNVCYSSAAARLRPMQNQTPSNHQPSGREFESCVKIIYTSKAYRSLLQSGLRLIENLSPV